MRAPPESRLTAPAAALTFASAITLFAACVRATPEAAINPDAAVPRGGITVAGSTPVPCAAPRETLPSTGALPAGFELGSIAGRFAITLVATRGPAAQGTISGSLELARASADTLTGAADIALDRIGGVAPGGTRSDGRIPALALRWFAGSPPSPAVTIRLGALRAPAGTIPIEGAHMALTVSAITADGFTGTWSSGTGDPQIPGAAGYFCAARPSGG